LLSVQCTGEKQQAINHVEKLFEESKELVCIFLHFSQYMQTSESRCIILLMTLYLLSMFHVVKLCYLCISKAEMMWSDDWRTWQLHQRRVCVVVVCSFDPDIILTSNDGLFLFVVAFDFFPPNLGLIATGTHMSRCWYQGQLAKIAMVHQKRARPYVMTEISQWHNKPQKMSVYHYSS